MHTKSFSRFTSLFVLISLVISMSLAAYATASAAPARATTNFTFTPVADTYVAQDLPDTNFGTNPSLRVDNSPLIRSYLRFTVSGLNGEAIQSAKLRLYATSASDAGYSVYSVSDNNWNENTITFNNSPAAGNIINKLQPFLGDAWTEIDISSYIKTEGTYNLLLTTTSETTTKLASKDSGSSAPQLIVSTSSQVSTNTPTVTMISAIVTAIVPASTNIAPTATKISPTATAIPPTATSVPPTATKLPPTATSVPPTATTIPPTATSVPPTATVPAPINGKVWYVDNQATGNNTGTSWQNAWKSLTYVNFGTMGSGSTLYISGGATSKIYAGNLKIPAGTIGITITKGIDAGHNGEVIFDGGNVTQYGVNINAVGTPVQNIIISKLTFRSFTWAGVYGSGANSGGLQGITVDNCKFIDFNRAGVFFEGNNNLNNNFNLVVKNSSFDDNNAGIDQSDGIFVQVLKDFTADHNYIVLDNNYTGVSDLHSDNIQSFWVDNVTYSNNVLVQKSNKALGTQMLFTENGYGKQVFLNNVFIRNTPNALDTAIRIKSGSGSTFTASVIGNTYYGKGTILSSDVVTAIKDNIFYGISQPTVSRAIYITLSGSVVSNNIFYDPNNQFPSAQGGVDANPMFVSANFTSTDLHLQSSSPAISTGENLGSQYSLDIEGKSRGSVWDIGAYQFK